jgi:hypothetical protein
VPAQQGGKGCVNGLRMVPKMHLWNCAHGTVGRRLWQKLTGRTSKSVPIRWIHKASTGKHLIAVLYES